ncbi:cytosol aminopeptidase [Corallococcus coralloides DSM 2259]|uniref:Probable cytosol aminopeptidase n=1 Tax=Corallococcus coralloides (strain ATCC 25202 / DSM 2259 / NBRC 100086 / M2) TaxID=1144275 RepID=H8N1H7_CORCM|nr:leucyl aminopeptidase [Corallococcus coralloides]AFE09777.1 cytosol aminopeptidase [Corallococcus coralloides DSM 2259]
MLTSFHSRAQAEFHPAPSIESPEETKLAVAATVPTDVGCVGTFVGADEEVKAPGLDRAVLKAAGFEGKAGQTLLIPRKEGPPLVAVGLGARAQLDAGKLRDAAAAFARTVGQQKRVALQVPDTGSVPVDLAAQALTEGVLLARYRYRPYKRHSEQEPPLENLTLVPGSGNTEEVEQGMVRGGIHSRATAFARDLANSPATLLTAARLAEVAESLAKRCGLEVEIFDGEALARLGCGGLLGVNAGSAEPPRMIKLTYTPRGSRGEAVQPLGRISLVGKGIMFDSGGLGLKPNDLVHATMKGDMSGAGAILAAMTTLKSLGCRTEVTAYLMCTDNMPSGTAMKLGDVLTVRGGKTVEVINTDAEGRLVMSDALVLATEQSPKPDAIVDIATLTGACQRALGVLSAGVMGNDQSLVEQVKASGERTGDTVWQLPLDRRLRQELESEVADMKNVGGDNAGAITAGLFLEEFVAGLPWAHIDMAGTARAERDNAWRSKGATGYGTRLLIDFVMGFQPTRETRH